MYMLGVSWSPCVFGCAESLQDSLFAQAESLGVILSISLTYPHLPDIIGAWKLSMPPTSTASSWSSDSFKAP